MLFKSAAALCSAAVITMVGNTIADAQSYTTRIEPRPFYGAVVTLEEGVRVIRPLPPERHVIINPDHGTPLTLGFNETNIYDNRTIRKNHYSSSGSSSGGRRFVGGGAYVPGYHVGASGLGRYGAHHATPRGHGFGGGHR